MPWDGSGTYSPPPATFPEVNGTLVDAARFNNTITDIAAGISLCLTKNGQNAPVANLPMGGFKHTGAAAAAVTGEYVTWNQTGVKFPAMGIKTAPFAWDAASSALDLGVAGSIWDGSGVALGYNTYFNSVLRAKISDTGSFLALNATGLFYAKAPLVAPGDPQTFTFSFTVDDKGIQTGCPAGSYRSRALSSATSSAGTTEAAGYASEVYDLNGNFNPTTGRFTAPKDGVYLLTWVGQANSGGSSLLGSFARVNGTAPNYGSCTSNSNGPAAGSAVIPMSAGQYVSIWMTVSGGLPCIIDEFSVTRIA